ncbi:MAG: thioredoxin [Nannocystaceae bacterium]
MASSSPHVIDVSPGAFDVEVIERSYELPVLVDFWASWCGPCRMLGPVLEAVADEAGGRLLLAKVDTEAHPEPSARYGVRSIPYVVLFVDGQAIANFVGALPKGQVLRFLDQHIPNAADLAVKAARAALGRGDRPAAEAALEVALAEDPKHAGAHLELARLAVTDGDREALDAHVQAIAPHLDEAEEAAALVALADLGEACREGGGEAALRERLAADEDDHLARYQLGCCLAVAGERPAALAEFLAVIQGTRRPPRDRAHKAMLTLFKIHGRADGVVDRFQRQLQIYL